MLSLLVLNISLRWCLCTPGQLAKALKMVAVFGEAVCNISVKQLTHQLMSSARRFHFTNTFCLYTVFSFFSFLFFRKGLNHMCVSCGGLVTCPVCVPAPYPVTIVTLAASPHFHISIFSHVLSAWSTVGCIWYERNWKRSKITFLWLTNRTEWMNVLSCWCKLVH